MRPSKMTPEIVKAICAHVEMGVSHRDAALAEGIVESTFYEWMKRPEFSEPMKKAELKDKLRSIKLISKAGLTKWQANAWKLERKFPEEFAMRARLEHTGKGGGPIQHERRWDFSNTPPDEVRRIARGGTKNQPKG